jgi:L-asparaginase
VHLPLFVRKTHTSNPSTFCSPLTGPIGWILENNPRFGLHPALRHYIGLRGVPQKIPPVGLLTVALGDDGRLISTFASLGYQGLVVEALGGGHTPSAMVQPLAELSCQMPTILTSRVGNGEVLRNTYGFPGSEIDLISRGLIHAGILDGPKSRILLTLLLVAESSRNIIIDAFTAIGTCNIHESFRFNVGSHHL